MQQRQRTVPRLTYALQADKLAIKRIKEDKEIPYMIENCTTSLIRIQAA